MTDLPDLERRGDFIERHIGPNAEETAAMLAELGLNDLDDLLARVVPFDIVDPTPLALTETIGESAVIEYFRKLRQRNKVLTSLIGMGYYDTVMPAVIQRNVLENPGWYTAYTPYQAEISQGRLEALLNFQQLVIDLTGLELANASLLDEATAAAEAMAMCKRLSDKASMVFFADRTCHPQTLAVLKTRASSLGFQLEIGDPETELADFDVFGVLLQYPGTLGEIVDPGEIITAAHRQNAKVAVTCDLLSLLLLKPPGQFGADMALGSAQRFGVPMGYGGPHAAFFATREAYKRQVPGRIIGLSRDCHDQPALRMALQTREQHIRRDQATSNICTAEVLPAVLAAFYAVYHGPEGLKKIAARVHCYARILAEGLRRLGYHIPTRCFFDTFTIETPNRARQLIIRAQEAGLNLRFIDSGLLGLSLDEATTRQTLRTLWRVFAPAISDLPQINALSAEITEVIPASLRRQDAVLQQPVFSRYRSETEMMRYLRRLARRDIALDRAMIPLGSCTMKLNAAVAMATLSHHDINGLHPFAPLSQSQGYQQLFEELEAMLCDLTGFAAFSLQPNAGSQGEYAGLLVIRKFHQSQGQGRRDICLIPASAHGTNPASAVMAGLIVVVLACDDQGNISLTDLKEKVLTYRDRLAALMITYPSTHGVFEADFREICAIVHKAGGQVYLDGANFNALAGLCRPGWIGVDVAHLNLHKTFAIPHGGGGPGCGPIGVLAHLAPFLPDHPVVKGVNRHIDLHGTCGAIAAAPWGSASILTIAWAYVAMMGAAGLKRATLTAILNANYIARRLAPYYPVLYTDKKGWVAHECILDCRSFKPCGVTVEDIAKRLIDYGFHAPTVSFPVAGTLMIEPTESESKRELDRFCEAMIAIRREIEAIETGQANPIDNVLKNAPHSHRLLLGDWTLPYSRRQAFFPDRHSSDDKYWPPVGRIDNVQGDRHLICGCQGFNSD